MSSFHLANELILILKSRLIMFELEERMAVSCYQLGWFYLQLTLEIYQDMIIWNELMLFDGTESKFNNNLVSNLVFGNRLLSERDGSVVQWMSV